MTKKSKIALSSILAIAASSALIAPVVTFLSSCSSSKKTSQDYSDFVKNGNKTFIDIPNHSNALDTKTMVSKILHDKDGIKLFIDQLADSMIFKWFMELSDKLTSLSDTFKTKIDNAKKAYKETTKKLSGQEIQDLYLDPNGGTIPSYIFKQTINDLKTEFTNLLFNNNYLTLNENGKYIPVEPNSGLTLNEIDKPENVNGASPGERNKFGFNPQKYLSGSDANQALQTGIADFVNYIFDSYVKENMPIITPSILYKNAANPDTSQLFNKDIFTSIGTDGTYSFQYFKPIEINSTEINSSIRYQNLLTGLKTANPNPSSSSSTNLKNNLYVDGALKGAINFPKNLTEDSSTILITNLSDGFEKYVTPYASAITYKFLNPINKSTEVVKGDFDTDTIMGNFITKEADVPAGYFKFPYETTNAFTGAYAGMTGIKDAVDINNSAFIMIRNEFGVHVIGIDRFEAIEEAWGGSLSLSSLNKVVNEFENTLLWRAAQDEITGQKNIDLMSKLKDYFNANISKLILGYAFQELQQDPTKTNNLFWKKEIKNDKTTPFQKNPMVDLALSYIKFDQAKKAEDFKQLVRNKIYDNQSKYNNNDNPSSWTSNGIAGVLPYNRNPETGEFDTLIKLTTLSDYDSALSDLNSKIEALMTTIEPGTASNYFKDDNKPKGVSTYVYTNNFVINLMLCLDTSANIQKNVFDRLISDIDLELEQNDNDEQFFDFKTSKVKNINNLTSTSPPNVSVGNYTELNKWINTWINDAIQKNIIPNLQFAKIDTQNQAVYGDWTTADFATKMTALYDKDLKLSNFANGEVYDYEVNKELRDIVTALLWLLDWNKEIGTYSFDNLVEILKEPLESNNYQVGYVGWINQSNDPLISIAKKNNNSFSYGVLGTNASPETQLNKDFTLKQKAILMNKLNSYSYMGSTNPYSNLTTFGNDMYFGKNNTNYYRQAQLSKTNTTQAAGFLGFQIPNSSYITYSLPNDLYSSNQKLLTQNVSNKGENFKGFFYQFNKNNDPTVAKKEFVSQIDNEKFGISQIVNLSTLLLNVKFNFTNEELKGIETVQTGVDYTIDGGKQLTEAQRKEKLKGYVNQLPENVFAKIDGEYLWNNSENSSYSSTMFKTADSVDVTQYAVSQFNLNDVNTLVTADGYLDPNKLLGLSPDTFFKAVVELARNSEVLSRAKQEINDFYSQPENQITVLSKPLYYKVDNKWVKNKSSFEK